MVGKKKTNLLIQVVLRNVVEDEKYLVLYTLRWWLMFYFQLFYCLKNEC